MKQLFIILVCLMAAATTSVAQQKIKASDIIKQINEGRAVEYTNIEIEGHLDLTNLENERPAKSLFSFDNGLYKSTIEVPVKFTGCTFLGDVLAYYHIERERETHTAHFQKDAIFKNCVFKKASEFKYTQFNGTTTFEGCTFNREANFKYAEFSSSPLFSNAKFESGADFKYAEFSTGPLFTNAKFESGADFKYTKFPRETSFEKATFHGLANFKYTKFTSPLNIEGVAFEGSEDFKYTKIDGRSFTSYLVHK